MNVYQKNPKVTQKVSDSDSYKEKPKKPKATKNISDSEENSNSFEEKTKKQKITKKKFPIFQIQMKINLRNRKQNQKKYQIRMIQAHSKK